MKAAILTPNTVELDGVLLPAIDPEYDSIDGEEHLTFAFPSENGARIVVDIHLSGTAGGEGLVEPVVAGTAAVFLHVGEQDAGVFNEVIRPVHGHVPDSRNERLLLTIFGPTSWSCTEVKDLLQLVTYLATLPARPDNPVTTFREVERPR